MMRNRWHKLFLQEKPSVGLSFFRIFVALATGAHVVPTLLRLPDNYLHTAFKIYDFSFFPAEFVQSVQMSPDWLVRVFAGLFCVAWFCFLIGWHSQASCIPMTAACYYFYALNSLHVGTLSWDILLVTLFLMCLTPYHGDYFSIDCLKSREVDAYRRRRPFFIQRLLQLQIGLTYFYTGLYKISWAGNWLSGNPIYYLMHYPAIFFFLFPPQLLLFIDPGALVRWIEGKRRYNQSAKRSRIIYDGNCGFCRHSLHQLKIMDLFDVFETVDSHSLADPAAIHPRLGKTAVVSQLHLIEPNGELYGGFEAFRRMSFSLPMLYPLIPLLYFPGTGIVGPWVYRLVARNRYLFHANLTCRNNACFR